MFEKLKAWWYRRYKEPFTVAVDRSPFWAHHNQREELFHVIGRAEARRIAHAWVDKHQHGAARLIPGHVYWVSPEADKDECLKEYKCCDPAFHEDFKVW